MKNEKYHSSNLQQDTHNIIKPEYFYHEPVNKNLNEENSLTNHQTYPYINLHISFENRSKNHIIVSYFCTISTRYNETWKELDRTEIKYVDHYEKYIKFSKFFTLAYVFQVKQQIKFCLYQRKTDSICMNNNNGSNQINQDIANSDEIFADKNELETYQILGECEILLSSIVLVSPSKEVKIPLKNKNQDENEIMTFLRIKPEQVDHCSSIVNGQIICEKLKKSRWATCNDPFFIISKKKQRTNPFLTDQHEENSDFTLISPSTTDSNAIPHHSDFTPVYQSEVNKKMQFKPFSIPYQILCNMDQDVPIRISFYCQRKHKKPKIIGYNETTFSRLFLSIDQVLPVFHVDNSASIVGSFKIVNLSIQHKSNFYDYLQTGIKLNYITVIDFTTLLKKKKGKDFSSQKFIDNFSFSISSSFTSASTSSSTSPQSSSLSSDTNFNDKPSYISHYQSIPAPLQKRKTRNSFIETKPHHVQHYHSSSSSSSPNPFAQTLENERANVYSTFSCANIENYELHKGYNENSLLADRCIISIGDILSNYNNCNLYPALGFGAEFDGKLKNCFPLSLNMNNPCVNGIDGIIRTFHEALSNNKINHSGPTLFSPVIKNASRYAIQSFEKNRSYSVVVILTEGIINDMQDTIDAIVDTSRLPLSIILVGINDKKLFESNTVIGNRIKSEMSILNSFNVSNRIVEDSNKNTTNHSLQLISRNGRKMERNVVKFVLFDDSKSDDWNASEILKDIPSQLVEWTEMNGIKSYNS